jgi:GTPase SAR1 family protein
MKALWIDEHLLHSVSAQSPNWYRQKTVNLPLANGFYLDDHAKRRIDYFVNGFVRRPFTVLRPAQFIELLGRSEFLASSLAERALVLGATSVATRMKELHVNLGRATFRVAVVGPTRAGKSTLINALLQRTDELLPTGDDRTTAVPIVVGPGEFDEVEVTRADGSVQQYPATREALAMLADQQALEGREAPVLVRVRVRSPGAHVGIELFDAPGLHDPSAKIREVTDSLLRRVHAFVYVLDVSTAAHGGFSVRDHDIEDLKEILSLSEHVFLVGNKADVPDAAQLQAVRQRVVRDLGRAGLSAICGDDRFVFASAREALEWQATGKQGQSPLLALESVLWKHLLRENMTGVARITRALTDLAQAVTAFAAHLEYAQANSTIAVELDLKLQAAAPKVAALHSALNNAASKLKVEGLSQADEYRKAICDELRDWLLRNVELGTFPSNKAVQEHVQPQFNASIARIVQASRITLQGSALEVDRQIALVLRQVGLAGLKLDTVEELAAEELPPPDLSEIFIKDFLIGSLLGWLAGAIAESIPVVGWAIMLARFFWRASPAGQQSKADSMVAKVDAALLRAYSDFTSNLGDASAEFWNCLHQRVADRLEVFIADAKKQLVSLGVDARPGRVQAVNDAVEFVRSCEHELSLIRDELAPDP